MGLNTWWVGDSRERYWMEITDRDIVGESLVAPRYNDAGREEWSYETVRHVRPGDVVFHWRKSHGPALTGYSHCHMSARASSLEWQSRGTYGRARAPEGEEEGWEALLQGYRELETPVHLDDIRRVEEQVRATRDALLDLHKGPIYFPYALSDKRPLRSAQAYLVKFPADLVEVIPGLSGVSQMAVDRSSDEDTSLKHQGTPKSGSGYGREQNPLRRRAVESYAVEQVIEHYDSQGFTVTDVGATASWDVTAVCGSTVVHIEVKGSTTDRTAIDITEGEVRHAEDNDTVLIVIDQIRMDSQLVCSGGRWRYWAGWIPERDLLIPTSYRHPLLPGGVGKPPSQRIGFEMPL